MKRTTLTGLALTLIILSGCAPPPVKVESLKSAAVFYPPLPQRPRLQFLRSIKDQEDLGKTQGAFEEFLIGKSPVRKIIGRPYDIGSSKGKIYILDRKFKKVLILDLAARNMDFIRDRRLGTLSEPSGIWVTEDDVKYVADMKRKQIVVFGPDNEYVRAYGDKEMFGKPVDVAVYKNRVYVADMDKHQILVLNKETGEILRTIGQAGTEEGHFNRPSHVVVDHNGNIYVNDAFNYRIQKFDPEGNFVKAFGFHGDTVGAFARPKGLDIDREGYLYVADAAFENVQIFDDRSAKLLLFFGAAGAGPGSMYLPTGVHIDYDNVDYFTEFADPDFKIKYLLYVVNTYGQNKLSVYGFGDWVGPSLPGEKE